MIWHPVVIGLWRPCLFHSLNIDNGSQGFFSKTMDHAENLNLILHTLRISSSSSATDCLTYYFIGLKAEWVDVVAVCQIKASSAVMSHMDLIS